MPYRAGAGGGMFGSHAYADSRPQVNVASAIDAAVDGASTLIRQAYQRRLAANEAQERREAVDYQRARDAIADRRADEEAAYRRARDAAQDATRALEDRRSALERGFTPEHSETTVTPSVASVGPVPAGPPPRSAIRAAMAPAGELPAPAAMQVMPPPPSVAPIRSSELTTSTVPETYDPRRGAKFALAAERADQEANRDAAKARNAVALKQLGGELAESLARLKASLAKTNAKSVAGRALTANKLEDGRTNAAIGLIDFTDGSYDAAVDYLNGPDGGALRELGVEPRHLMYARSRFATNATDAAMRLQTGRYGLEPGAAAAAVADTRERITRAPSRGDAAAPTGMASLRRPGGAAGAGAPTRGAAPPTTPQTAPPDDFTDDELADAFDAGKTTDEEIRKFIEDRRKAKPPRKK